MHFYTAASCYFLPQKISMIKASYFSKVYCQIPFQGLRFSSAIVAPTSKLFACHIVITFVKLDVIRRYCI